MQPLSSSSQSNRAEVNHAHYIKGAGATTGVMTFILNFIKISDLIRDFEADARPPIHLLSSANEESLKSIESGSDKSLQLLSITERIIVSKGLD